MKLDEQPIKAFPHSRPTEMGKWCGMDLRDYFAAKAMQSLAVKAITDNQSPEDVAIASYMFADELMKARKESQ
jgi:hypothetical protein